MDGDTLTIADVNTTDTSGTVIWDADGTLVFTPGSNFIGTTTFTYTVSDGNVTDIATVTVTVTDPDDPASNSVSAVADSASTDTDTPVNIPVLVNDYDPENDDFNLTGIITQPAHGKVSIENNGIVIYTADPAFVGTDTFEYELTDVNGNTDVAIVTVTVADPANDQAPNAVADTAQTDLDIPVTIDVLGNDTHPNNDDLTIVSATTPANGTVTINPDGTITYTPNSGFSGYDTFMYTITDSNGDTASDAVTVTVQAMGTIAGIVYEDIDGDGIQDADEPGVKDMNVTITDSRGKIYQLLTDENGLYSQGVLAGSTTIILDESPYESIIQTEGTNPTPLDVPSGGIVNDVDGYRAALGRLVQGTPRPPVVGEDNATGVTNSATIIDVVGNDTPGTYPLDPTTVRIIDPVNGEVMTMNVPGEGIWSVNPATGEITFTPVSGFVGDPTAIEYTVYDTNGAQSAYATINIDYPPVANDDDVHTIVEGETVTVDILQNDQNTSSALDPESVSLVLPDNATDVVTDGAGDIIGFIVPNEGEWSVDEDTGAVTFVPDEDLTGSPTPVKYTVKEENGDISNEAIIEILYPASAAGGPVATDNLNVPITSYNPTVIDVFANGDTYGANGPGTVEITFTQPAHGSVVLDDGGTPNDPTDDVLIYTPAADVNNIADRFTYTITDAAGNISTATVTLNVKCASSQTSDSGDALGTLSIIIMMFFTVMSGLYFVRKEEERGEA